MKDDGRHRFNALEKAMLTVIPSAAAGLIKAWCLSCSVTARINEHAERRAVAECTGAVYATWHQRMFYFFHDFGARHVTMMISRSRDGEFANEVALRLGFLSVRGSSKRGGRSAMHELIDKLRGGGHTAGMMADGPTGPPRVLKMGTVRIARDTGMPIIPMMYGARRRIVLNTWDRYFIPAPFTDIVIYHGSPVFVPKDAHEEECERIRVEVERIMNDMADVCDTYWGGAPVGKPGLDIHPAGRAP